jgi:hypothetical protein
MEGEDDIFSSHREREDDVLSSHQDSDDESQMSTDTESDEGDEDTSSEMSSASDEHGDGDTSFIASLAGEVVAEYKCSEFLGSEHDQRKVLRHLRENMVEKYVHYRKLFDKWMEDDHASEVDKSIEELLSKNGFEMKTAVETVFRVIPSKSVMNDLLTEAALNQEDNESVD